MSVDPNTGAPGIIAKCEGCEKTYRIHPEKLPSGITSFPCRACGTLVPVSQAPSHKTATRSSSTILIVVDEEELGQLIQRILRGSGYVSQIATTGKEAVELIGAEAPDLMLISVYLSDMMGYELIDELKGWEAAPYVPSILLSSVHHAARYKRAPTSLYGADDYLERHHLPDLLVPKINRLLSSPEDRPGPVTPDSLPPPSDEQVQVRRDLETMETDTRAPEDPKMGEIQRMCRVIAGDIALYNEDVIASTSPEDLFDAIASDLSEGETLLMNRFPEMEDQLAHLLKGEMVRLLNSRGIEVP